MAKILKEKSGSHKKRLGCIQKNVYIKFKKISWNQLQKTSSKQHKNTSRWPSAITQLQLKLLIPAHLQQSQFPAHFPFSWQREKGSSSGCQPGKNDWWPASFAFGNLLREPSSLATATQILPGEEMTSILHENPPNRRGIDIVIIYSFDS